MKTVLDLAWIVPALPLAGSIVLLLFGKRIGEPKAGWFATGMLGLAFVWSLVVFWALMDSHNEPHVDQLFTWLGVGGLRVEFGLPNVSLICRSTSDHPTARCGVGLQETQHDPS